MDNLSITTCSFHLKKLNGKTSKDIYYLNKPIEYSIENDENVIKTFQTNVLDMFISFAQYYSNSKNDDAQQKSFSCELLKEKICKYTNEKNEVEFQCIPFKIKSGSYGSSADIYDKETRKHKLTLNPNDVVEKTFYAFVIIPSDNEKVTVNKGLMIFQNIGIFGIKTITTDKIRKFFSSNYKSTIRCLNIAPQTFIKKVIIKQNINKFIMIRNHKSSDGVDNYHNGVGSESRILGNLCFSESVWESLLEKINYVVKGKHNLFEYGYEKYDTLKLDVKIGERNRTINLHNIDNLSIIESIPDSIRNNDDGFADFNRLKEHILNVAKDYIGEMVLEIK